MARLFLSYAHEDASRARPLAEALLGVGHEVWWDRQIHGGSRFADEIDRALKDAQAVLVLWSRHFVHSAWVQDEAEEGRDSGRLVPIVLDSSKPPLGFRQYQSIDLSSWNGGNDPADLSDLLRAAVGEETEIRHNADAVSHAPRQTAVSICVLPFVNMSGDVEQEYFSDGISEDIITDLSKVSSLSVVARNTAFTFKGRSVRVPQVARELNVTHVLEGSVRKAGSRVRITAQLINGAAGDHLWAERYDRDLTNIFAIQDEISAAIVKALKLKLLPEEKGAIENRGTHSAEAYDLYLMARQYWVSGNDGDSRRDEIILRICRQATDLDPNYARAWALMALQMVLRFRHGKSVDDGMVAAERALALDPQLAEAHAIKARYLSDEGRHEEANLEMQTALRLDPHSWEAIERQRGSPSSREGSRKQPSTSVRRPSLWTAIITTRGSWWSVTPRWATPSRRRVLRGLRLRGQNGRWRKTPATAPPLATALTASPAWARPTAQNNG